MTEAGDTTADAAARARGWRNDQHTAVCDVIEPWEHGTVVRATDRPSYWDLNVVRVEDDPSMSLQELIGFADEALAGLEHRGMTFDDAAVGESLRAGFEAEGWQSTRLIWMRHEVPPPPGPDLAVEEVPYDAVADLRTAWHYEDFPDQDPTDFHAHAREISLARGARLLAVIEDGEPVAYAQIEERGAAAEVTSVYVHPDRRGSGLGTALTRASVEASGDVADLWIVADDDARAKEIYARLGFRPVWTSLEFLRLPPGTE